MIKKILTATLAIMTMVSCSTDKQANLDVISDVAATFVGSTIETRTSGNDWEALDQVGIYMFESGATSAGSYSLARENVKYISDAVGTFTVSPDASLIYYPQSSTVDFYAYYPYQNTLGTCTIDVLAQNIEGGGFDHGAVDFMTASVSNKSKSSSAVSFAFTHRMAMVTLIITPNSSVASLEELQIQIQDNFYLEGTFNVISGSLIDATPNISSSVSFKTEVIDTDAEGNIVELEATAMMVPMSISENLSTTLKFTFDNGDSFSASMPTDAEFLATYNNIFNVSVGYDEVVFDGCEISDWEGTFDMTNGTIDADEQSE